MYTLILFYNDLCFQTLSQRSKFFFFIFFLLSITSLAVTVIRFTITMGIGPYKYDDGTPSRRVDDPQNWFLIETASP